MGSPQKKHENPWEPPTGTVMLSGPFSAFMLALVWLEEGIEVHGNIGSIGSRV